MQNPQNGCTNKLGQPSTLDSFEVTGMQQSGMVSVGPGCGTGLYFIDLQRTAELERKCATLQSQASAGPAFLSGLCSLYTLKLSIVCCAD